MRMADPATDSTPQWAAAHFEWRGHVDRSLWRKLGRQWCANPVEVIRRSVTGMATIMVAPRTAPDRSPMPLDSKRMIFGGFEAIVSA